METRYHFDKVTTCIMELVKNSAVKYKSYGYDPPKPPTPIKRIPSEHVKDALNPPIAYRDGQTRLCPEITKRHDYMEGAYQHGTIIPYDEPLFQPFPPVINFRNYQAFKKYSSVLQLRNNDMVIRRVRVFPMVPGILTVEPNNIEGEEQSIYMEIGSSKVACGMEVDFTINFYPEHDEDFEGALLVVTEREQFVVPVVCYGLKAILDIPDYIHFPSTPCKATHKKNMMIRNIGQKKGVFRLQSRGVFRVFPPKGEIQPGLFFLVMLHFRPKLAQLYEEELLLTYTHTKDLICCRLSGNGCELDIGLSTDLIIADPCHVRSKCTKTFHIINNSSMVARYIWPRFATEKDEIEYAERVGEVSCHQRLFDNERIYPSTGSDSEPHDIEELQCMKKAFTLIPTQGDIWPGSIVEVKVTFCPPQPLRYIYTAQLTITGKGDTLPIQLQGLGIGPECRIVPDFLDLGDLHLFSIYEYEVELQNRGELEAHYELLPSETSSRVIFTFIPSKGILSVGKKIKIFVTITSTARGPFEEKFLWMVDDTIENLVLELKGNIINPAYEVEPKILDFGLVSYGFNCQLYLMIKNTSPCPLYFTIRLNHLEASYLSLYKASKDAICIEKQETEIITIFLVPSEIRRYDAILYLDMPDVGDALTAIPITATCLNPNVTLVTETVEFLNCLVRYTYTKIFELRNTSLVPATFEIIPQEDMGKKLAIWSVSPSNGIIGPNYDFPIVMTLTTQALGYMKFKVLIKISGKDNPDLEMILTAITFGPTLRIETPAYYRAHKAISKEPQISKEVYQWVPRIDYGRVRVLTDHREGLVIRNLSYINAPIKIFASRNDTVYRFTTTEYNLEPYGVLEMEVIAFLDDVIRFKDRMNVTCEGGHYIVPITSFGFGSCIISGALNAGVYHFGTQLTLRPFTHELLVMNKGRRGQTLSWENDAARIKQSKQLESPHVYSPWEKNKKAPDPVAPPLKPVFMVNVEKVLLPAYSEYNFAITGYSTLPGLACELLICKAALSLTQFDLHKLKVDATLESSKLRFSSTILYFVQNNISESHDCVSSTDVLHHQLTCHNISSLKLSFTFITKPPFRTSQANCILKPNEYMTLDVTMDRQNFQDKVSIVLREKLEVAYEDIIPREKVDLIGEINYPNLRMGTNIVQFGNVIENTWKRFHITISNISSLDVNYVWSFMENKDTEVVASPAVLLKSAGIKLPITQILDILPIRGHLAPGQYETIEFSYFAHIGYRCHVLAVCKVEAGPEYSIHIFAASNVIKYQLSRTFVDFEKNAFNKTHYQDLVLINSGKVPISYKIDLSTVIRKSLLKVIPPIGFLNAGEKQIFKLSVYPGLPGPYSEAFRLQVEYFHPHNVLLHGNGIYPCISIETDRVRSSKFLSYIQQAYENLMKTKDFTTFQSFLQNRNTNAIEKDVSFRNNHEKFEECEEQIRPTYNYTLQERTQRLYLDPHGNACSSPQLSQKKKVHKKGLEYDSSISTNTNQEEPMDNDFESIEDIDEEIVDSLQPTVEEVEHEADRLILRENILELENIQYLAQQSLQAALVDMGYYDDSPQFNPQGEIMPPPTPSSTDTICRLMVASRASSRTLKKKLNIQKLIVSKFIVDFGEIKLGQTRKQKIKITNGGLLPVAFKIDKVIARENGFNIEPDRVLKISGSTPSSYNYSEEKEVELSITFKSDLQKNPQFGQIECCAQIFIREGPQSLLYLRAFLTLPLLELSTNYLDFGSVKVGHCKALHLQFYNGSETTVKWAVKQVEAAILHPHDSRDLQFFTCTPNLGTMQSNTYCTLEVRFRPSIKRHSSYHANILIEVEDNPDIYIIRCKARGYTLPFMIEPMEVTLQPTLPKGQPAECLFEIVNKSNQLIEVYSLDWDPQILLEEEMLRHAEEYNEKNLLYLEPREAGEKFWPSISEQHAKKLQEESKSKPQGNVNKPKTTLQSSNKTNMANIEENEKTGKSEAKKKHGDNADEKYENILKEDKKPHNKSISNNQKKKSLKGGKSHEDEEIEVDQDPDREANKLIAIIYGAPMIGKTTQAKLLSKLYRCPLIDIENFILTAIEEKKLILPTLEKEKRDENRDGKGSKGDKLDTRPLKEKKGETSKGKSGKPGEKEDVGKQKVDKEKGQRGKNMEDKPIIEKFTAFQTAFISLLKQRFKELDCKVGMILDSLRCVHFEDPVILMKCVLYALELKPYTCNREAPDPVENEGLIVKKNQGIEIMPVDILNSEEEKNKIIDDVTKNNQGKSTANIKGKKIEEKEVKLLEQKSRNKSQVRMPSRGSESSLLKNKTKIVWKGETFVHTIFLQSDKLGIENRFAKISETYHSIKIDIPSANNEEFPLDIHAGINIESSDLTTAQSKKSLENNPISATKRSSKLEKDTTIKVQKQTLERLVNMTSYKKDKDARKSNTHLSGDIAFEATAESDASKAMPQYNYPYVLVFPDDETLEKFYVEENNVLEAVGGCIPFHAATYLGHKVYTICINGLQHNNLIFEQELHDFPIPGCAPKCPPNYTLQIVKKPVPERFLSYIPNFAIHTVPPVRRDSRMGRKDESQSDIHARVDGKSQSIATTQLKTKIKETKDDGTKKNLKATNPKSTQSKNEEINQIMEKDKNKKDKLEIVSKEAQNPKLKVKKEKISKEIPEEVLDKKIKEKKSKTLSSDEGDTKKATSKEKEASGGKEKSGSGGKEKSGGNPLAQLQNGFENKTRWLIPPFESVTLMLRFWSEKVGKFQQCFVYERLGGFGHAMLSATAICSVPEITVYKLVKKDKWSAPDTGKILLPNEGCIDFGPLSIGSQPDDYLEVKDQEHCKKLFIQNSGLFDVVISFEIIKNNPPKGGDAKSKSNTIKGSETSKAKETINTSKDKEKSKGLEEKETSKKQEKKNSKPSTPKGDKLEKSTPLKNEKQGKVKEEKSNKSTSQTLNKKGKQGGGGKMRSKSESFFLIHPNSMELKINEGQMLRVFGYPSKDHLGHCEDRLVFRVKNNPEPIDVKVMCLADFPRVELEPNAITFERLLIGYTSRKELNITNVSALKIMWRILGFELVPPEFYISELEGILDPNCSTIVYVNFTSTEEKVFTNKLTLQVCNHKDATKISQEFPLTINAEAYKIDINIKWSTAKGDPASNLGLNYGTLKVGEDLTRPIILENKGKYVTNFSFVMGSRVIKKLFVVSTMEGKLEPKASLTINVHFNKDKTLAEEVCLLRNEDLILQLIDPLRGKVEKIVIIHIDVETVYSKYALLPNHGIHFGYQTCEIMSEPRILKILNTGFFPFRYHLIDGAIPFPDPLSIIDQEEANDQGISSGNKKDKKNKVSNLKDNVSATTAENEEPSGASKKSEKKEQGDLHSKSQGSKKKGKEDTSKKLEDHDSSEKLNEKGKIKDKDKEKNKDRKKDSKEKDQDKDGKRKDKGNKKEGPPEILMMRNLTINSASGIVHPGTSKDISVTCLSNTPSNIMEKIRIEIEDENPSVYPRGHFYEISANSCWPGISIDPQIIFEEHRLVDDFEPSGQTPRYGTYSTNDQVFSFGAVVLGFESISTKVLDNKTIPCKTPRGVRANLRIDNPFKVPCSVNFSIIPCVPQDKDLSSSNEPFCFELQPLHVNIPPHEYRYISFCFRPLSIQKYCARFEANVVGAGDTPNKQFKCGLRGEGTLPHVKIEVPSMSNLEGGLCLKFPHIPVGRSRSLPIVLRNPGLVPAIAWFSMPAPTPWIEMTCDLNGTFIPLKVKKKLNVGVNETKIIMIRMTANEVVKYTQEIRLMIDENPFDCQTILITGEGYNSEVMCLGLPNDSNNDEEINFTDGPVGLARSTTFVLQNNTLNKDWKFVCPTIPHVKFIPTVGHLQAGASKSMIVTFHPTATVEYKNKEIKIQMNSIIYKVDRQDLVDWDDRLSKPSETKNNKDGVGKGKKVKIEVKHPGKDSKLGKENERKSKQKKGEEDSRSESPSEKPNKANKKHKKGAGSDVGSDTDSKKDKPMKADKKHKKEAESDVGSDTDSKKGKTDKKHKREAESDVGSDTDSKKDKPTKGDKKHRKEVVEADKSSAKGGVSGKSDEEEEEEEGESVESEYQVEPPHEVVKGSNKDLTLRVNAVADNIRYACDTKLITFKTTMMFQTRTFTFPLKNLSKASMYFAWQVMMMTGNDYVESVDSKGLYTISPAIGQIAAGQEMMMSVRFSPREIEDCSRVLACEVQHLHEEMAALRIEVKGKSTRPWCHFELARSDYVTALRRDPALPGPDGELGTLDPSIHIVEVTCVGTQVSKRISFVAINPTSRDYEFMWQRNPKPRHVNPDLEPDSVVQCCKGRREAFKCISTGGEMRAGMRYEMLFEFTPTQVELAESFWSFDIVELDISVQFLLVGRVKKPDVSLGQAALNFGLIQVGKKDRRCVQLVNAERLPYSFQFDRSTYSHAFRPGEPPRAPILRFLPDKGIVREESSLPVEVLFSPHSEGCHNFNVLCNIISGGLLALNVKGEGYAIHEHIRMEAASDGAPPILLTPLEPNTVHYGQVLINDTVVRRFIFSNAGTRPYEFMWDCSGGGGTAWVDPVAGEVGCGGEEVVCALSFCPNSPAAAMAVPVTVSILHGSTYRLSLSGSAYRPKVHFSFLTYDFGPCFPYISGLEPASTVLAIENRASYDAVVEMLFDNTSQLEVETANRRVVLAPAQLTTMRIIFRPRKLEWFKESIPFKINSLDTVHVAVTGEGVPVQVELLDPKQKCLTFKPLKLGQSTKISVRFVNRSKAAMHLQFHPSRAALGQYDVECLPAEGLHMKPRLAASAELHFRPQGRIPAFTEGLEVEVAGARWTILWVSGACVGTQVCLSSNNLPFGEVVLGARHSKMLSIHNTGDLGTNFQWLTKDIASEFSIYPEDGFLAPHQVAVLDVTFHPSKVNADVSLENIPCLIECGATQYLTLTGRCVEHAPPEDTLNFSAPVRSSQTTTIQLKNETQDDWLLLPRIQNDCWKGPSHIAVKAGQTVGYNVTYLPLLMCAPPAKHRGSIFFPLPTGSALFYELSGDTQPPLSAGEIKYDVKARSDHPVHLQVHNWLRTHQQFTVSVELSKPAGAPAGDKANKSKAADKRAADKAGDSNKKKDKAAKGSNKPAAKEAASKDAAKGKGKSPELPHQLYDTLRGPTLIDAPGNSTRDCVLHFWAQTPGFTDALVTFTNALTGEYIFYNITFEASEPAPVLHLDLRCLVRQKVAKKIMFTNPLDVPCNVQCLCEDQDVLVPPSFDVLPRATVPVEVFFRPVLDGTRDTVLTLTNPIMGDYVYNLKLMGLAAGFEQPLTFVVPLGGHQSRFCEFVHYFHEKTVYSCAISQEGLDAGFSVDPKVSADACNSEQGVPLQVQVNFEPHDVVAKVQGLLTIDSPTAGVYKCNLLGTCVSPTPQGPILIVKGKGQLNFTNVFTKLVQYTYTVDNSAFVVGKGEKLAPKKVAKISVSFKNAPDALKNGRLTISSPDVPFTWLFYLQALDEEPKYCHLLTEENTPAKKGDKKEDKTSKKGDQKDEKKSIGSKKGDNKKDEAKPQAGKKGDKAKKKA